jgi:hypothetical protein
VINRWICVVLPGTATTDVIMEQRLDQHMESRRDVYGAGRDLYLTLGQPDGGVTARHSRSSAAYDRSRPLFIQYLNPEVLSCYGFSFSNENATRILEDSLRATRLAALLTDAQLVFPASYIFEVPRFHVFLQDISTLITSGNVSYVAPVADLNEYRETKAKEYRNDSTHRYDGKMGATVQKNLVWQPRIGTATASDIATHWRTSLDENGLLWRMIPTVSSRWTGSKENPEEVLRAIPERLDGQAFIGRFVQKVLPVGLTPGESTRINMVISRSYLLSYLTDLRANMLVDFSHADLSCGLLEDPDHPNFFLLSARRFDLALRWIGLHSYVHRVATWNALLSLRSMPEFGELTSVLYARREENSFRTAVIRTRRGAQLDNAATLTQAKRNVAAVASQLC